MFKAIKLGGKKSDKNSTDEEISYRANTTILKLGSPNINFKQKQRQRLLNQIPKKFFIILVTVIILITFLILFKSQFFNIKDIEINPKKVSCASSVEIIKVSNLSDKKIFSISEKNIEDVLKAKFLCIKKVAVSKNYPSTINLNISERQPIFQVTTIFKPVATLDLPTEATPSSEAARFSSLDFNMSDATVGGSFQVDSTGFVFSSDEGSNLVRVNIVNFPLKLGKLIPNDNASKIQSILQKLNDLKLSFDNLILIDDYLFVDGPIKVAFTLDTDVSREIASLQLILEQSTINSKAVDTVDLRFDKPIIIYLPRSR